MAASVVAGPAAGSGRRGAAAACTVSGLVMLAREAQRRRCPVPALAPGPVEDGRPPPVGSLVVVHLDPPSVGIGLASTRCAGFLGGIARRCPCEGTLWRLP